MLRIFLALLLGAADLTLARLAWGSLAQHEGLGIGALLLILAAVICHVWLFWP